MSLTVELGAPFEAIMDKLIDQGYATTRSEVIRQALIMYDKLADEEEYRLVRAAVESIVAEQKAGKRKTYTLEEVEKRLDL